MFRSSATIRISITLASITLCTLFAALALGMFPDRLAAIADGRGAFCESVTVSCSVAAQRGDIQSIESILKAISARNNDLRSAALRRPDGSLEVVVGDHVKHWPQRLDRSTVSHMQVPIYVDGEEWGLLELRFPPVSDQNWTLLPTSVLQLISFVVALSLMGHWIYLGRVLRHLDPTNVIPDRVRDTLDSLAEGLIVLDKDERIVLANEAFSQTVGQSPDELQGHKASDLPWNTCEHTGGQSEQPWERSIRHGVVDTGRVVQLEGEDISRCVMQVNSAPILDEQGQSRGVLATFSDVTALEVRNAQLGETLVRLKKSRDQISEQNERLRTLAMIDPLTQCLNRRAFFQEYETQVAAAERKQQPISYIIMDVDHFKQVNDNHGHKVGDEVLRQTSELLRSTVANLGFVCRYGGEEFSVLLPECDIDQATNLAELLREKIESTSIADLSITASFGVVQIDHTGSSPLESLDYADQALYYCKRAGRNRVSRWDQIPVDVKFRSTESTPIESSPTESQSHIPFTAVSVLLAALQSRDPETAEHSRRVANLSVEMAAGLMTHEQRYVLEVAALLHDVGKLSVPDHILQKPSPLTKDEWRMMDTHLRLGERTIKHAFASPDLIQILRSYRTPIDEQCDSTQSADKIQLAARILQIADAFDSMTSSRPYREAMPDEEAFDELRRCAGSRFDVEMVQRCIEVVTSSATRVSPSVVEIDTDTALRIGALFERLVIAIDTEDTDGLKEIASRLTGLSEQSGSGSIGNLAERLSEQINNEAPWSDVLELSSELLDLCRLTQTAYISRDVDVVLAVSVESEDYSASNLMPCANGNSVE